MATHISGIKFAGEGAFTDTLSLTPLISCEIPTPGAKDTKGNGVFIHRRGQYASRICLPPLKTLEMILNGDL